MNARSDIESRKYTETCQQRSPYIDENSRPRLDTPTFFGCLDTVSDYGEDYG